MILVDINIRKHIDNSAAVDIINGCVIIYHQNK